MHTGAQYMIAAAVIQGTPLSWPRDSSQEWR